MHRKPPHFIPIIRDGIKYCGVPDCERPQKARGVCSVHYQRITTGGGDALRDSRLSEAICKFPKCKRKHYAKNMCRWHYNRDPDTQVRIRTWWRSEKGRQLSKKTNDTRRFSPEGRYSMGQYHAKTRQREWTLSLQKFSELIKLPCSYCGTLPPPKYCGIWLDRKDTDGNYSEDNVTPCCALCNRLKNDLLTHEETLELIKRLRELRGGVVWS